MKTADGSTFGGSPTFLSASVANSANPLACPFCTTLVLPECANESAPWAG
jgi:hypothetical protein